jgi:truncated hemoglobin YjbI
VPLSETLGGDDVVKYIAEDFFNKIRSDKEFAPLFAEVNRKVGHYFN